MPRPRIVILLLVALVGCRTEPMRMFGTGKQTALAGAFSRDGQSFAAGLTDGTLRVWDVRSGKELSRQTGFTRSAPGLVGAMAFSADGMSLAYAGSATTVRVWNIFTNESPLSFEGHGLPVRHVFFAPDGVRLISASGGYGTHSRTGQLLTTPIRVITHHLVTRQTVTRIDDACPSAWSVAFAGDGEKMACVWAPPQSQGAAKQSPQIVLRDTRGGDARQIINADSVIADLSFSPDNKLICCGKRVWDIETGVALQKTKDPVYGFVDDRTVVILSTMTETEMKMGEEMPWFQATHVDVLTGKTRSGPTVWHDPPMVQPPVWIAPDGASFVDSNLRQWKIQKPEKGK